MAASLSDDAIAEILSYLPLKAATRLKIVCKSWRQLISTPYFRSLALRRPASGDVLGFFQHSLYHCGRLWLARLPDRHMKPTDQLVDGHDRIRILAVCDGIVFVVSDKRTYYVWNPSRRTGSFRCIQPPPLAAADGHYGLAKGSRGGSFEIVNLVNIEMWMYSSKRGTWKRLDVELPPLFRNISRLRNRAGAACARRSIFHWITDRGMIIAFDSIKQQYRQMNLPNGIGCCNNVWLGSVDGELYFLFLTGGNAVELWVLENYEEVRWMKVMGVECPSIISAPVFFDGESIAVVIDINEGWDEGLNFYNIRSRRWGGAQLISPYSDACLCSVPFIKDKTKLHRID